MTKKDFIEAFKVGWLWHDEFYVDENGKMWYKHSIIDLDEIAEESYKIYIEEITKKETT